MIELIFTAWLILGAMKGPADFNHDTRVGQDDFGHLQACLGTMLWVPEHDPACNDADLNGDGKVDAGDVEAFEKAKEG